ncbi:MAG: VanZ like protein [Phenylobacterium sp.]|nr:VanZ like protein [Phenylobacterium sp.]
MSEDRTLLGYGRYPDTGPLAVLARLAFLGAGLAIVIAVFLPPSMVPQFVRSHYLEHFAAFYVAALAGFAAMPRTQLRRIAAAYVIFATVLEASHLISGAQIGPLINNWVADLGGLAAAAAPIVVERFRRRFPRPI